MALKKIISNGALALGRRGDAKDMTECGDDIGCVNIAEFIGGAFVALFETWSC